MSRIRQQSADFIFNVSLYFRAESRVTNRLMRFILKAFLCQNEIYSSLLTKLSMNQNLPKRIRGDLFNIIYSIRSFPNPSPAMGRSSSFHFPVIYDRIMPLALL